MPKASVPVKLLPPSRKCTHADASPTLISRVTDAVIDQVVEWQSRPLDSIYPIVNLGCIVVKIRQDKRVINKAIYLALGVNMDDHKELLGMWLSENEGAKFSAIAPALLYLLHPCSRGSAF